MPNKIRILIVDDSRCFRSALQEALSGYDDIVVVGSEWNGQRALEFIRSTPPDLVTLDVSMPGMDGLQILRAIQHHNAIRADRPHVGVIMVSAYTTLGSELTVESFQAGAADFVTKPAGDSLDANIQVLAHQLVAKVRHYARRHAGVAGTTPGSAPGLIRPAPHPTPVPAPAPGQRSSKIHTYKAVLIAVSTGGPKALATLLPALCERIDLPILIVQHMPPGLPEMMTALVNNLGAHCSHPVTEARDGGVVQPRTVYFAPAGKHLVLRSGQNSPVITMLSDQPPENNFRPSADVLFRSAAHVYGGDVIVLILTGMLHDGTSGLAPLKRAGAHVIVQDEASSAVWGMPGSAVAAGHVDEIVPLDRIAHIVQAVIASARRS
jgi:two-component system, chemotaxis family, protein-glutamate methylesterase/glutaminase